MDSASNSMPWLIATQNKKNALAAKNSRGAKDVNQKKQSWILRVYKVYVYIYIYMSKGDPNS